MNIYMNTPKKREYDKFVNDNFNRVNFISGWYVITPFSYYYVQFSVILFLYVTLLWRILCALFLSHGYKKYEEVVFNNSHNIVEILSFAIL